MGNTSSTVTWKNFFKNDFQDLLKVDNRFQSLSIFKPTATTDLNVYSIVTKFTNSPYKDNLLLNRAIGCIMGHVIGDSMGSVLEFREVNYERKVILDFDQLYFSKDRGIHDILNSFQLKVGQYTDDFSMGLCLADSLLANNGLDCVDLRIRFLRWWFSGYNNAFKYDQERKRKSSVGLGGNIAQSFYEAISEEKIEPFTKAGDPETSGNGSIMRLSPIALFYHNDLDKAIKEAENQSLSTHRGVEAGDCCKLLAFILVKALNYAKVPEKGLAKKFFDELDMAEVLPYLKTVGGKHLALSKAEEDPPLGVYCKGSADRDWNWKKPKYRFSPTRTAQNSGYIGSYAMDGLSMALHCVYSTESFAEAVLKAANLGGDADSLAAVAGQLAGAIYGVESINPVWCDHVMKWDNNGEIPLRAMCCVLPEIKDKVMDPEAKLK
eukprot:TRINITY_DN1454_c0_g1_i1.p1 TRINITY_DN1454_c0_g1~~TRINITY_DN1454_c0_g1_i1.p1  ORF type:complete len:460 (-),score=34.18 TRINITY_DN1454_c0_g1_i1:138-1445(-)